MESALRHAYVAARYVVETPEPIEIAVGALSRHSTPSSRGREPFGGRGSPR
jgi:hypothetical protein